jgi:hypothetical protein
MANVMLKGEIDFETELKAKLKPCPFCGGLAKRVGGPDDPWYFIQCMDSECGTSKRTAARWNRRHA